MRQLTIQHSIRFNDRLCCVNCSLDLNSIIEAGYAPDDVMDYLVGQCVAVFKAREKLKKAGLLDDSFE